jgi:hypothetical protein
MEGFMAIIYLFACIGFFGLCLGFVRFADHLRESQAGKGGS